MHLKSFDTANSFKFPEGVRRRERAVRGMGEHGRIEKNPKYMIGNGKTDGYCVRACGEVSAGEQTEGNGGHVKFLKDPEGIKNDVTVDIADILSEDGQTGDQAHRVDNSYADLAKYLED